MKLYHGSNTTPIHDYDIVIGPIANDGVVLQLTNYREGIYTPEQVAMLLQDRYLDQQVGEICDGRHGVQHRAGHGKSLPIPIDGCLAGRGRRVVCAKPRLSL